MSKGPESAVEGETEAEMGTVCALRARVRLLCRRLHSPPRKPLLGRRGEGLVPLPHPRRRWEE